MKYRIVRKTIDFWGGGTRKTYIVQKRRFLIWSDCVVCDVIITPDLCKVDSYKAEFDELKDAYEMKKCLVDGVEFKLTKDSHGTISDSIVSGVRTSSWWNSL